MAWARRAGRLVRAPRFVERAEIRGTRVSRTDKSTPGSMRVSTLTQALALDHWIIRFFGDTQNLNNVVNFLQKIKMQKGSRELLRSGKFRKDRSKKRIHPKNRHEAEQENLSTSTSAKKLKTAEDVFVPEEETIGYKILNFFTVFSTIAQYVKCKNCDGEINFKCESVRGLGFKIMIVCKTCKPVLVPSCPNIGPAYEINRRFIFAMRLLGIGLNGIQKFCGIMDLPPPIAQTTYDIIVQNIHQASSAVCELLFRSAVKKEQELTAQNNGDDGNQLTVSGDGSWKKRGFTSLYGVSTIIGWFTGKVLDRQVKSSYCKACEYWSKKIDTNEYEEWKMEHKKICSINHEGSAGKMEVDAIKEIFMRSQERYGVIYSNYIGDGDSKTFKGLIDAQPYGEGVEVHKKECIGHVQKRMGTRLRQCVKKNKGLGGRNKLTGKLIDKLSIYYGLAIRRNCDSVKKMKDAIWATFYHYSSTDTNPQHNLCPEGINSWCTWQKAKAERTIKTYKHDPKHTLPSEVLRAIKPIYEDLSQQKLLERCVGGYTQNNNESLNNLIWKITPKIINSGSQIVQIAADIAACVFNDGAQSLLKIMQTMQIETGVNAHQWASFEDDRRLSWAERATASSTKEARTRAKKIKKDIFEASTSAEGELYGPGIDDSM